VLDDTIVDTSKLNALSAKARREDEEEQEIVSDDRLA
jgi:hypothetical protein